MADLSGGFTQAPQQAAVAFRACLEALARPGQWQQIAGAHPPPPVSPAAGAVLLTLVDPAVRLHLAASHDRPDVRSWIAFHCGAPFVGANEADFALGNWPALQPVTRFATGTPDYPDRSVTLIVDQPPGASNARLSGPGIKTEAQACLPGIDAFVANRACFPLGFDCLFTDAGQVMGLPRSTRVEVL